MCAYQTLQVAYLGGAVVIDDGRRLRGEVGVLLRTLDGGDARLRLATHPHHPRKVPGNLESVVGCHGQRGVIKHSRASSVRIHHFF